MTIHTPQPARYYYTFGPHPPLVRIRSGDTVVAHTLDALGKDTQRRPLPPLMKQTVPGTTLIEVNPVVGPVYVEGAAEGDLLAVHVDRIRLTREVATSELIPNFGSLTGEWSGHSLVYNDPVPSILYEWRLDLERNVGILDLPGSRLGRVEVPLAPFIGTIGVAPPYGRVEITLAPGKHGGNMDCADVCEGTTVYLPVWVEGAYLAFGDVHALQGDGEVIGAALEVTAEVTLTVEVLKRRTAEWPRFENDTEIMVAGSTRPLLDCIRLAHLELLSWLVADYGFERHEAWQLISQVSTLRIGNIVDPLFTAVARFPKRYLPRAGP